MADKLNKFTKIKFRKKEYLIRCELMAKYRKGKNRPRSLKQDCTKKEIDSGCIKCPYGEVNRKE